MKFLISIEVDLDESEITFLKKYIIYSRESDYIGNKYIIDYKFLQVIDKLVDKNIILVNSMGNISITPIGEKILDIFDRDKKINNLLNENIRP